jgi:hypothetical protein
MGGVVGAGPMPDSAFLFQPKGGFLLFFDKIHLLRKEIQANAASETVTYT